MSLMINQNITALNAWRNLNKTDRSMSATMEKLSSGLRINRAADDPSGLVTSEQMRAQVVGLKAAIKNSEKGISMIQTAEAALDKVHGLLDKLRGLALDSANVAANDVNMLAANQAEVTNILDTITRISENTQYGTKKLLDGTNSIVGAVDTAGGGAASMSGISLAAGQSPETLDVSVVATVTSGAAATPAEATFTAGTSGAALNNDGDGNPEVGSLAVGTYTLTMAGQLDTVSNFAATTAGDGAATGGTGWFAGAADETITITITGINGDTDLTDGATGWTFTAAGSVSGALTGGTVDIAADGSATFTDGSTFSLAVTGMSGTWAANDTISFDATASTATAALTDSDSAAVGTTVNLTSASTLAAMTVGGASFDLSGVAFDAADFAATASLEVTAVGAAAGEDTTTYTAALGSGTAVDVEDNGSVALTDENGNKATVAFGTLAEGTATFTITDNSLVFQIGANQNQTVKIGIQDVAADQLAVGVTQSQGSDFASLAAIDVTDAAKATDSLALIDAAIDQISVIRGNLGAFQANTLEANLDSLRVAAENLQASESVVRDTDMAAEMAEFTKYQIMLQAGTAMLAQANQIPNNILQLLR